MNASNAVCVDRHLTLLILALACAPLQAKVPLGSTPQVMTIHWTSATGTAQAMRTLVFKPAGKGPFKVLLFAHGRPAYAAQRAQLVHPMSYGHVRYWLGKGYAVVAPIRPGYGLADSANPTLGTAATKAGSPSATARATPATPAAHSIDPENSGVAYSASGQCLRPPNPEHTAQAAAHAQRAALDWVRQQPWARADHIVLEGQSVGGLATLALCAAQPPGVKGCINFAGGAGGNPQQAPAHMCAPEQTTQLMHQLGSQPQPPSNGTPPSAKPPTPRHWLAAAPPHPPPAAPSCKPRPSAATATACYAQAPSTGARPWRLGYGNMGCSLGLLFTINLVAACATFYWARGQKYRLNR